MMTTQKSPLHVSFSLSHIFIGVPQGFNFIYYYNFFYFITFFAVF